MKWGLGFRRRASESLEPRSRIDLWLMRASHLGQAGLFILTLAALYYTVLPLYQKAVLEEAIARKEIELTHATAQVEKLYVTARGYIVDEYVSYASGKCSGVFELLDNDSSRLDYA